MLLEPFLDTDMPRNDDSYRQLLRSANLLFRAGGDSGLDVNEDMQVDERAAIAIYYALSFPELVGGGAGNGFGVYRTRLIEPYANALTAEQLMARIAALTVQ